MVMDELHTARGVISVAGIVVLAECGRSAQRVGARWVEHRALSSTLTPNLCRTQRDLAGAMQNTGGCPKGDNFGTVAANFVGDDGCPVVPLARMTSAK